MLFLCITVFTWLEKTTHCLFSYCIRAFLPNHFFICAHVHVVMYVSRWLHFYGKCEDFLLLLCSMRKAITVAYVRVCITETCAASVRRQTTKSVRFFGLGFSVKLQFVGSLLSDNCTAGLSLRSAGEMILFCSRSLYLAFILVGKFDLVSLYLTCRG